MEGLFSDLNCRLERKVPIYSSGTKTRSAKYFICCFSKKTFANWLLWCSPNQGGITSKAPGLWKWMPCQLILISLPFTEETSNIFTTTWCVEVMWGVRGLCLTSYMPCSTMIQKTTTVLLIFCRMTTVKASCWLCEVKQDHAILSQSNILETLVVLDWQILHPDYCMLFLLILQHNCNSLLLAVTQ